jgi:hypothetical protein
MGLTGHNGSGLIPAGSRQSISGYQTRTGRYSFSIGRQRGQGMKPQYDFFAARAAGGGPTAIIATTILAIGGFLNTGAVFAQNSATTAFDRRHRCEHRIFVLRIYVNPCGLRDWYLQLCHPPLNMDPRMGCRQQVSGRNSNSEGDAD